MTQDRENRSKVGSDGDMKSGSNFPKWNPKWNQGVETPKGFSVQNFLRKQEDGRNNWVGS